MTRAILGMELRLRARMVISAAAGVVLVAVMVGALFPSLGDSIGDLDLPDGVSDLLGGGDFSTITGWLRTEIGSVYGPLVFCGIAIAAAVATTAGEEEAHILTLVLAHPVSRRRLLLAKAAGVAAELLGLAVATVAGLLVSVVLAGGGIGIGHVAALALHLLCLGLAAGALGLAIGAGTGRRGLAAGAAAGTLVLMFLVNGFAPSIDAIDWAKYLTLFWFYEGGDPLATGVHLGDLAVLLGVALALVVAALAGFARRDLRA